MKRDLSKMYRSATADDTVRRWAPNAPTSVRRTGCRVFFSHCPFPLAPLSCASLAGRSHLTVRRNSFSALSLLQARDLRTQSGSVGRTRKIVLRRRKLSVQVGDLA